MRRLSWGLVALLAACEARITDAPLEKIDGGAKDAALDGAPLGAWGPPSRIIIAATGADEDDITMTSDALEIVFAKDTNEGKDLYYASRRTADAPWSMAMQLPFVGAATSEETPRFSPDDRTLYFASDRAGNGNLDIYAVTRGAPGQTDWGAVREVPGVNTTTLTEKWYMPCGADRYVVIQSAKAGGQTDLVEGALDSDPKPITVLNSTESETGAFLTRDCLTIYFASFRTDPQKIFVSTRASLDAPWQPPTAVTDFVLTGGNGNQEDPWLSPDGRTFVFASDASGSKDIYISTR